MTSAKAVVAVVGSLLLRASAQTECAVPVGFPSSTAVDRSLFKFFATVDFLPHFFTSTPGFCRSGPTWDHEPALDTNAGIAASAENNEAGDGQWFCVQERHTRVGCMAQCETRHDCDGFDRPPIEGLQECCLFTGNNTGNGDANRICFSKDVPRPFKPGDLRDTSVTVLPVPFLSYLTLSSNSLGVVASADMGWCFFWQWCGFVVKDCRGQVLYKVEVEALPDIDSTGKLYPGTLGVSYVIKDGAGMYLGRSSHLTDGYQPIRLLNAENEEVSMLITDAGFWRRTFFPLRWFVNTAVTAESATQVPLSDPRLLTLMVTFQFRNLGYFGFFWVFLLILLAAAYYYIRRERLRYGTYPARGWWKYFPFSSSSYDEEQEFLNTDGGCCTGRPKKQKTSWGNSFTLVSSPAGDML
ncbi:unnamed protein product [Symbiodinium natans]|uniref:Transmembrane protein n=1 Tax=Symbiodinium natans TaxID=878477 RepID=A0A812N5T3_9DINO|nr:unnamed protein product [Symbiodinium natans]